MANGDDMVLAGRYRPIRLLSQDAFGVSYLAVDLELDACKVVVTMLPGAVLAGKRCFRSVKDAAIESLKLLHPNIASVRALEDNGGKPFLVVDYVEGQPLNTCLDDWGKLSEDETKALLEPVASALDYAHGKDIVHRDVRPSNITVNEASVPTVRGFCVACEVREAVARLAGGNAAGPVSYMSPEQLTGAAPTPAQDVYSFAAIAYECLTGHPPFYRGQVEYQVVNVKPEPLPGDTPFTRAIMRALSKDPAKRPETCADVLAGDMPPVIIPAVVAAEPVQVRSLQRRPAGKPVRTHEGGHTHSRDERMPARSQGEKAQEPVATAPAGIIDVVIDRIKSNALFQAAASVLLVVLLTVAAFGISSCSRGVARRRAAALDAPRGDKAGSFAMSTKYAEFFGVKFGTVYKKLPEVGDDVGFGTVTAVSVGRNGFDVALSKPLFKVFGTVHVRLVGGDSIGNNGRIAELKYTKEGEGVDPAQARKVVAKIASLIGDGYGIDMGDPQSSVNNSYFSQKYRDEIIDIRISCAVSQESTSFFISVENMQVRQ